MCGTGIRHRSSNTCCKEKLLRGRQWMLAVNRCRQCIQQTQQKSQFRKHQKTASPHVHIPTQQLQHTHYAISWKWEPHTVTGGCDTRGQCSNGNVRLIHTTTEQWNYKWWSETGMVCRQYLCGQITGRREKMVGKPKGHGTRPWVLPKTCEDHPYNKGSGYRTSHGSFNFTPYWTTSCNMTVMHDENTVGLVAT